MKEIQYEGHSLLYLRIVVLVKSVLPWVIR